GRLLLRAGAVSIIRAQSSLLKRTTSFPRSPPQNTQRRPCSAPGSSAARQRPPSHALFRAFLFFFLFDGFGGAAPDGISQLVPGLGLKAHTRGPALPLRRRAQQLAIVGCISNLLLQQWLALSRLRHYGFEFLAIIGHAAVGDIIAIPTGR